MPTLSDRIFSITYQSEEITFFRRFQQQRGRDILAVKLALGQVAVRENRSPSDNSIGREWFDCETGNSIEVELGTTFDKKLKRNLMAFQIQNQFLIISYYFEKYAVKTVNNKEDLLVQVETSISFFDSEFGNIGEATLAVLHGWRPDTTFSNKAYLSQETNPTDQVSYFLYQLMDSGAILEPTDHLVEIVKKIDNPSQWSNMKEEFSRVKQSYRDWASRVDESQPEVYFTYKAPPEESGLFLSTVEVADAAIETQQDEMTPAQRVSLASRIFEPNPLLDPDPFIINPLKIGYFLKTPFTFQSLPLFSGQEDFENQMLELYDQALTNVLKFYNKPIIWSFKSEPQQSIDNYFKTEESRLVSQSKTLVTTNGLISSYELSEDEYDALYSDFDPYMISPLMKFVDFRTPSLRPGDTYRAYFEIDRSKLEIIRAEAKVLDSDGQQVQRSNPNSILENLSDQIDSLYCVDGKDLTDDEVRTQYEKYKSFASKKKLEISRELRAAYMKATTNEEDIDDIEVDLGVFGKVNLSDEEISNSVANLASQTVSEIVGAITPDGIDKYLQDEVSNDLSLTFQELKIGCDEISENFAKAAPDVENFNVQTAGKNKRPFNILAEGNKVKAIPDIILTMANRDQALREWVKEGSEYETVESFLSAGNLFSSGTIINIQFVVEGTQTTISQIKIENKQSPKSFTIFQDPGKGSLLSSLTDPRSVEYLRNIYPMTSLSKSAGSYLSQILDLSGPGCGPNGSQAGLGMAYVQKFTKDISTSGNSVSGEYNPFHNWKRQIISTPSVQAAVKSTEQVGSYFERQFSSEALTSATELTGLDKAVPLIGPNCKREELYPHIIKQFKLKTLLCRASACLRLPDFEVKIPDLNWPELPDIPILKIPFGFDDLDDLLQQILTRGLCAFLSGILDVLKTPMCQEQLVQDLYGAASDTSPQIQKALVAGILDLGIPKDKIENAKSLLESVVNILTPREICSLLDGRDANDEVYHLIETLAKKEQLSNEFSDRELTKGFFLSLGIFVGPDICAQLNRYNEALGSYTCTDVSDVLNQIRSSILRGADVTSEQLDAAVSLANENLLNKSKALEALGSGMSLADLVPEFYDIQNQANQEPPPVTALAKTAADAMFESSRMGFLNSMNQYVESMYLEVPRMANPQDPGYDPLATKIVQRATANLQRIAQFYENSIESVLETIDEAATTTVLRYMLEGVCDDYETEIVQNFAGDDVEVYKVSNNIVEQDGLDLEPQDKETYLVGSLIRDGIRGHHFQEGVNEELLREIQVDPKYRRIMQSMFPIMVGKFPVTALSYIGDSQHIIADWSDWKLKSAYNAPDGSLLGDQTGPNTLHLNRAYLNKINSLLDVYRKDIEDNIEKAYRVVSDKKLLDVIRDFYNISLERIRERSSEIESLIRVTSNGDSLVTSLSNPTDTYQTSITMTDSSLEKALEYEIKVEDPFFFGANQIENQEQIFTGCDLIPDRFLNQVDTSRNVSPRAQVYKNIIMKNMENLYSKYTLENTAPFPVVNSNIARGIESVSFLESYEGVLEQLTGYLGASRLFSDSEYIRRIDSRVQGKAFLDPFTLCVRNPKSSIEFGAANFDSLVSNLFEEEYKKESGRPENSILVQDFSKPGAFEKAIQNTALRGFVRICLLEIVMKGAISYSAWDIDFIKSDSFFREYTYRYVRNQIEHQPLFSESINSLHECLERLTGIKNLEVAMKNIIESESLMVFELSKIIFENTADTDYSHWLLNNMKLLDVPTSKIDETWVTNLREQDISQNPDNFMFLEKYIRINGPLRGLNANRSQIARAQYESFSNLKSSILGITLRTNLDFINEQGYVISNAESVQIREYTDEDSFPDTELMSLSDFSALIRSLFDNNSEINRYFHDITRRIYEPGSAHHSAPQAISQTPAKAIRRQRNRYVYNSKNLFSSRFMGDFDLSNGFNERVKGSKPYVMLVSGESGDNRNLSPPSEASTEPDEYVSYGDRFYLIPVDGQSASGTSAFLNEVAELNPDFLDVAAEPESFGLTAGPRNRGIRMKGINTSEGNYRPLDPNAPWIDGGTREEDRITQPPFTRSGRLQAQTLFLNSYGKVEEEKFNSFVESSEIESETWEESIIDLVGAAAPVFKFPGESEFFPNHHFNDAQRREMANVYGRAILKTSSTDQRNTYKNRVNDFLRGTVMTFLEEQRPGSNFADTACPAQPMRLELESHGYSLAFADNDVEVGPQPADPDANWRIKGEKELLGTNEYKVPVRILITQIKNRAGTVMQTFVKFVLPKFLDFSNASLDSHRAAALYQSVTETLRAYRDFLDNTTSALYTDPGRQGQVMRADHTDALEYYTDYPAGAINLVMGNERNKVPVMLRQRGATLPDDSSIGPAFCSTSKFYSLASSYEASAATGNFAIDEAFLDDQFGDPGMLMRKRTQEQFGQFSADMTTEDKKNLNMSFHYFYDYSIKDMMTSPNMPGADVSIGNLISWFGQKRRESFWGQTSKDVSSLDEEVGCLSGPSLFYRDGRGTFNQYMTSIRRDVLETYTNGSDQRQAYLAFMYGLKDEFDTKQLHSILDPKYKTLASTNTTRAAKKAGLEYLLTRYGPETDASNFSLYVLTLPTTSVEHRDERYDDAEDLHAPLIYDFVDADFPLPNDFYNDTGSSTFFFRESKNKVNFEDLPQYRLQNLRNLLKTPLILQSIRSRYDVALREIGILGIMEEILQSFFNPDDGSESPILNILTESEIKYGIRMVLNSFKRSTDLNNLVEQAWSNQSAVSEEERTGKSLLVLGEGAAPQDVYMIPIASIESKIENTSCFNMENTRDLESILGSMTPQMFEGLTRTDNFKDIYEFAIPYKRMASVISAHSTSMLAGYSEMPNILTGTKSSLAGTFNVMSNRDNLLVTGGGNFGPNFRDSDLLAVQDRFLTSQGQKIECLELPGISNWAQMIAEMVKKFVLQFPSIVLRGIADQIDPTYKEMKRHYLACQLEDLRFGGIGISAGTSKTPLGLRGSGSNKKYIPINIGLPVDIAIGITELPDPSLLAASISHLVGYIFGGPLALLDPSYAFKIPCLDVDVSGASFSNWDRFTIGNLGRYGHPLTPITALALITKQLPGDIELKNRLCLDNENIYNPQLFCNEEEE